MNLNHPATVLRLSQIERELTKRPMSIVELSKAINLCQQGLRDYIKALTAEPKQVYVYDWDRQGNHIVPLYAWGNKKNKRRPARMPRKIVIKRYEEKLRNDVDRKIKQLNRRRASRLKPHRDWSIAALYGVAA